NEVAERNAGLAKEMVHLCDGQESLWQARQAHLPARNSTDILDLLHATPRLWTAAHCLYAEGSQEAEAFARERILRVSRGTDGGRGDASAAGGRASDAGRGEHVRQRRLGGVPGVSDHARNGATVPASPPRGRATVLYGRVSGLSVTPKTVGAAGVSRHVAQS